jgi:NADPH2:quinone reductase
MLHDMRLGDLGPNAGACTVFVTGAAGGVGGALVELAKARGMKVIGSAGSPERAAYARSLGADHVIDYRSEAMVERVTAITGGRGVDLAFDHVVGPRFTDFLQILADYGALVFYNIHTSPPERDLYQEMCAASAKSPSLHLFNMHTYDRHPQRRRALMTQLIALFAGGGIRPRIGARLPLAEAAEAHRQLEAGAVCGKIILVP